MVASISSRSELNRLLLAATFATLVFASVTHVASYFGSVVIHSGSLQGLLTWVLVGTAIWKTFFDGTRAIRIPWLWWGAVRLAWFYAVILAAFPPTVWPRMSRWLGFDGADSILVNARTSSALQLAAALNLFVIFWFLPSSAVPADEPVEETKPNNSIWTRQIRRLVVLGIALPLGLIAASNVLRERSWGAPDVIEWTGTIALFRFFAGMIVIAVCIMRDAIHLDE